MRRLYAQRDFHLSGFANQSEVIVSRQFRAVARGTVLVHADVKGRRRKSSQNLSVCHIFLPCLLVVIGGHYYFAVDVWQ